MSTGGPSQVVKSSFYSANPGEVDVAAGGAQIISWTAVGENIAVANGALQIGGNNMVWVVSGDPTGFSLALGNNDLLSDVHIAFRGSLDNGENNTGVGQQALYSNTTGGDNTAVGAAALQGNTFGLGNTAVGNGAMIANDMGSENVALGDEALYASAGSSNVALGAAAMQADTSGTNNTVIGFSVASTNLNGGQGNILIGTTSNVDTIAATTNNNLNIGNLLQGDMTNVSSSFNSGNLMTLYLQSTASGTDYLQIAGGASGSPGIVTVSTQGSDANVSLALAPLGAGSVTVSATTANAALDISANTSSLRLPVGTTGQRPGTPANGMIRYNSTLTDLEGYISGAWTQITTGGSSSTINLGTSASTTNPQRSGDATTGLFSATTGTVSIASAGTDVDDISATGPNILGTITSGSYSIGYQINGNNAIWQDTTNGNLAVGATAFPTTVSLAGGYGTANVAVGKLALNANTTGQYNTAVGYEALYTNTTGQRNTAVGWLALASNTTGSWSTAVGFTALRYNTIGVYNTAIGFGALGTNTTGINNTAVGVGALGDNTTGINNTAVGYDALLYNTTGQYNTALGYQAFLYNTSGSVDYLQIAGSATGSHSVTVSAQGTDTNVSLAINPKGTGNIVVGAGTGNSILDLSASTNAMVLPVGTTGQRPGTPANGMLRYNSTATAAVEAYINGAWAALATGGGSTTITLGTSASVTNPQRSGDATTGFYSAAVNTVGVAAGGIEAMQWNTIASGVDYLSVTPGKSGTAPQIAVAGTTSPQNLNLAPVGTTGVLQFNGGTMFWQDTTHSNMVLGASTLPANISQSGGGSNGQGNVAVGVGTLNVNTTGYQNTAVGYLALNANTTAIRETAVGYDALGSNTTGVNNTAVGWNALNTNTTGAGNTAMGVYSLTTNSTGVNNTAVGYTALGANSFGGSNTAVGVSALYANTNGGTNTAIGVGALYSNTTGGDNTGLGTYALTQNTTGMQNTAIGYGALGSNTTGIANTALGFSVASTTLNGGSNNILIGTGSAVDTPASSTSNFLNIGNTIFATGTNAGTVSAPAGNVGIGTSSPQATLDVNGYARLTLRSSQPVACSSGNAGAIALNHLAQMCACNGTSWIFADSVGAACSW